MDKWDEARESREAADNTLKAAIDRQAAIDSIRAIAEDALARYEDAWNGYDRANDRELVDFAHTPPKVDEAAISRLQAEITAELDNQGITLIHRIEAEMDADWDTMDNSDGSGTDYRLVCRPAAMWTSEAYGPIVVIKAVTYAG